MGSTAGNTSKQPGVKALEEGLPCGRLLLKIATTEEEKRAIYELRFRVFNEELGEGIPENLASGLDHDAFDPHCDHLMVIDAARVVGTYRLLHGPRRPPQGFYTETEFSMEGLPLDVTRTVELGRGCIEKEFRKQTTLMALFWGLHRYMDSRQAQFLVGCGSFPPMKADDAEATFQQLLSENRVDLSTPAGPLPKNTFQGVASRGVPEIPPLIRVYLEFGAKVFGRPAFDPVFNCYDVLILMDTEHLTEWGNDLLTRFDKRLLAGAPSEG